MYVQQNPIDPTLPASWPADDVAGWPLQIDQVLDGLFTPTTPPLLGLGENLWAGLASVVVVWTGLRIAFAGHQFNFWTIVQMILGLAIPLAMLRFYAVDIPGVALPFPLVIPAGADQIALIFQADISAEVGQAQARLTNALQQNLETLPDIPWGEINIFQLGKVLLQNLSAWLLTFVFGLFFTLVFIVIYAICLAQTIWAKLALAILIYLGPAMIPWLVWSPMSFLFWGWFRALWTYSLYSVIAHAVLRVFAAISVTLINSMNQAILAGEAPTSGPTAGAFLLAVIPFLIASFLAALKVPELAGAIVGSPGGGSGFLGVAASAATKGGAKVARMAAGAVK